MGERKINRSFQFRGSKEIGKDQVYLSNGSPDPSSIGTFPLGGHLGGGRGSVLTLADVGCRKKC